MMSSNERGCGYRTKRERTVKCSRKRQASVRLRHRRSRAASAAGPSPSRARRHATRPLDRVLEAPPSKPDTQTARQSSLVSASESHLIAGAANRTTGSITAQESNQETVQLRKKIPLPHRGQLATPAAIRLVSPDWITPNTKWLYRLGILIITKPC
jgi:hypothetical protein